MFYAHSSPNQDESAWQLLRQHLESVGGLAAAHAEKFDAAEWGRAAGLLHDLGKYTDEFQARLHGATRRVDHSTAGALVAIERWNRLGKLIAFAVAGHHTGLANGMSGEAITSLGDRLACSFGRDIPMLDREWESEVEIPLRLVPPTFRERRPDRRGFQFALFTRMLFSCLVDADRRDTAGFYNSIEGIPESEPVPTLSELRSRLDAYLAGVASSTAREDDPGRRAVNASRAEILTHVRSQADERPGLFSLTVPTGGGKTLTSLAFAVDHAIGHELDRVIYVIPFTSIIEQTAGVFRDAFGDLQDAVLEHHSALDWEEAAARHAADADYRDGERELRLAMESWDKPIIVTTAVQFFESLFSNRTTRCRKLHNIARSVIILDEAQKLPIPLLRPCVAALDELARNYKTSIVLCTATQPAIVEDPGDPRHSFEGGLQHVKELAPDPTNLYKTFRRVTVEHAGMLDNAALTERLKPEPQVLCIVNARAHARALYDAIESEGGARHLTTLMCAKHRSEILKEIKHDLDPKVGKPCRLVATSLVEAGVDVDFPTVYRAEAGIDSIAQAAGRCNREGRRDPSESKVVVFETPDHKGPAELGQFASIGRSVARRFEEDMLSLEAVDAYFRELYWLKEQGHQSELDKYGIIERCHTRAATLDFEFEIIARIFRMIEEAMVPIIIPYDEDAKDALRELEHANKVSRIARKLQPYIVRVPPKDREALIGTGTAFVVRPDDFGEQFVRLRDIDPDIYDPRVGLRTSIDLSLRADKLII